MIYELHVHAVQYNMTIISLDSALLTKGQIPLHYLGRRPGLRPGRRRGLWPGRRPASEL